VLVDVIATPAEHSKEDEHDQDPLQTLLHMCLVHTRQRPEVFKRTLKNMDLRETAYSAAFLFTAIWYFRKKNILS